MVGREFDINNDQKTLSFYAVEDGDQILVRWSWAGSAGQDPLVLLDFLFLLDLLDLLAFLNMLELLDLLDLEPAGCSGLDLVDVEIISENTSDRPSRSFLGFWGSSWGWFSRWLVTCYGDVCLPVCPSHLLSTRPCRSASGLSFAFDCFSQKGAACDCFLPYLIYLLWRRTLVFTGLFWPDSSFYVYSGYYDYNKSRIHNLLIDSTAADSLSRSSWWTRVLWGSDSKHCIKMPNKKTHQWKH